MPVFKTGAINHSANSPHLLLFYYRLWFFSALQTLTYFRHEAKPYPIASGDVTGDFVVADCAAADRVV